MLKLNLYNVKLNKFNKFISSLSSSLSSSILSSSSILINNKLKFHKINFTTTTTQSSTSIPSIESNAIPLVSNITSDTSNIDIETQKLINNFRNYYMSSDYNNALIAAKELRKFAFYNYGDKHPVFASSINNQALIHKLLGEYQIAHNLYEFSVTVYEKCVGKEHVSYVIALTNYATAYILINYVYFIIFRQVSINNFKGALENYETCLLLRKKLFPSDHVDTLTLYNLIGTLYRKMGDFNKAIEFQSKALGGFQYKLGNEHTSTATVMNNLALTYKDAALKDLEKKEEYFKKSEELLHVACGIRSRCLGKSHSDFIVSMHNLAEMYQAWGHDDKSINVRKAIMEILHR